MKIDYSIIIPFYNEEENIPIMLQKISRVMEHIPGIYEIIAVDDGSSDATFLKLVVEKEKYSQLKIIKFRRNFGQTQAMQAGIDYSGGDIIITMDGDLQNDPEDIPRLLQKMAEGYDVVSGWRKSRKDHILRRIPSQAANFILTHITGVKIHDNGCSLKVYNASILKKVHLYSDMHRFIPAFAFLHGAKVGELVVQHHPRTKGMSKYGFSRIWKVLFDLFTLKLILNFAERPIVWFATMGGVSLILSAIFFFDKSPDWQSQIVWPGIIVLLGLNAFALFGWGLVCELTVNYKGAPTPAESKSDHGE